MDKKQCGKKRKRTELEEDNEETQKPNKKAKIEEKGQEYQKEEKETTGTDQKEIVEECLLNKSEDKSSDIEESKEQKTNSHYMRLRDRKALSRSPTFQHEDRPSEKESNEGEFDSEWKQSEESKENIYVKRSNSLLSDGDEVNPVSVVEEGDDAVSAHEEYIDNRRAEIRQENNQILENNDRNSDLNTNSDL